MLCMSKKLKIDTTEWYLFGVIMCDMVKHELRVTS